MEFMAKIELHTTMYEMRRKAVSLTFSTSSSGGSALIKAVDIILHIHSFLFSGFGSGSLLSFFLRFFLLFVGFC